MASVLGKVGLRNFEVLWALAGLLEQPLSRLESWLDDRSERRSLYGMDERSLADIGISHPDFAHR
jgi:uncharacterized protein YjiS (DUF1127 family)